MTIVTIMITSVIVIKVMIVIMRIRAVIDNTDE